MNGDVILLSAVTTVMTLAVVAAVRQVYERFILGIATSRPAEVIRSAATSYGTALAAADPAAYAARTSMAARVGLCANGLCAKPIDPGMARAGYLCASCAGIDAPPYLPRG